MSQKVILFLNGQVDLDFCEKYISSHYLNLSIICADNAYLKIKRSVDLFANVKKVIGDFDSTIFLDDEKFKIDCNQDTTDFEKCLNYLIQNEYRYIYVFGASGGEMDHFISNMSIALNFYEKLSIEFIDKYSHYFFIPKKIIINNVNGKMFSIMPFGIAENICCNGLKYHLNGQNMALGSMLGARNYAIKDTVKISYDRGNILLFISHNQYKDRIYEVL